MKEWLFKNAIAILALVVATVGGWPGILKIIEHFRPIALTGSIKFFAITKSIDPPEEGILIALTLVNEGNKNLVWRKLDGTFESVGKKFTLIPKLIPQSLLLNGEIAPQPDLLNQQTISTGSPVNTYLLLTATPGSFSRLEPITSGNIGLRFEVESGKKVDVKLSFEGHPIQKGENYPSHGVGFK
jgi:hypothetical protein